MRNILASVDRGAAPQTVADATAMIAAAHSVADEAARNADEVDRDAVFPHRAFAMLRSERLLGAMIPVAYGGDGATLETIAEICRKLGAGCASTGMIYAMHQMQVACLVNHATGSTWHEAILRRIAREQMLLASATSEESIGGALRTSGCAVNIEGDNFHLLKMAPTISYGAHADGILVTARRHPDAAPSDQVLVSVLKPDYTLECLSSWDTLGMRGTCSNGFRLEARGLAEQVLPVPFGDIAEATMAPVSHILWASVWTGVAADAVLRAKTLFRSQARERPGTLPPSAVRVAEAVSILHMMEGRVELALAHHRRRHAGQSAGTPGAYALAAEMNTLKTSVSTLALEAVRIAMLVCGMAGYKQRTPYSLGRHLRDLWSAPLMINNDRILTNTANLLLADRSS